MYSGVERGKSTCGFECQMMTAADYGDMMERGFRRCGTYFYYIDNFATHWGSFSTRLDVTKFKMSKNQKKAWNRWQKYLDGDIKYETDTEKPNNDTNDLIIETEMECITEKNVTIPTERENKSKTSNLIIEEIKFKIIQNLSKILKFLIPQGQDSYNNPTLAQSSYLTSKITVLPDKVRPNAFFSNMIIIIASSLKIDIKSMVTTIDHNLMPSICIDTHDIKIMPDSVVRWLPKDGDEVFSRKIADIRFRPINRIYRPVKFEMTIMKAKMTDDSFDIYKMYCQSVHDKKKESSSGFDKFLCQQVLEYKTIRSAKCDKELTFGCFHMNYYLEDELVAVSVVDIVPKGLKSVYFFFHPKLKALNFGTIGALYEIEYIQKLQADFPEFRYYSLGSYIQQTPKMNYKANFGPFELLCPKTKKFIEFSSKIKKAIDEGERVLGIDTIDESKSDDIEFNTIDDIRQTLIDYGRLVMQDDVCMVTHHEDAVHVLDKIIDLRSDVFVALGKLLTKRIILAV